MNVIILAGMLSALVVSMIAGRSTVTTVLVLLLGIYIGASPVGLAIVHVVNGLPGGRL